MSVRACPRATPEPVQPQHISAFTRLRGLLEVTRLVRTDDELDHLGMPKTVVDWTVSDHDLKTLRTFAAYLRDRFAELKIQGIEWRPEVFDENAEITGITDTFHPMGGCRMGTDPRESVVCSSV